METPLIPGLKESVIEACKQTSWVSTRTLLLQWLKEDTIEYQQLKNIPEDSSVIFCACYNGYVELISLFVKNGFPVNHDLTGSFNALCSNMLHFAAMGRQLQLIKYLISLGADVNSCSYSGTTPLHSAIKETFFKDSTGKWLSLPRVQISLDVIKCLLESGCNVNFQDNHRMSPLCYAAQKNNFDLIKMLVEHGANVNVVGNLNRTPLYFAVETVNPRFEIIELLLNAGANPNLFENNTLLHTAVLGSCQKIVELLLEKGANVNAKNDLNQTPLYKYVFLLHRILDNVGNSFLGEDGINIVGTLIIWGADVNIFDDQGRTLLHWAAWQGNIHLVKLLIDKGLDVKDKLGKKAIHYAADCDHHEIVQFFIDYYYERTCINSANL